MDAGLRDVIFSEALDAALEMESAADANVDIGLLRARIKSKANEMWSAVRPEERAFEQALDERLLRTHKDLARSPSWLTRRFVLRQDVPRRRPVGPSDRLGEVYYLSGQLNWKNLAGTDLESSRFDDGVLDHFVALGQGLLERSVLPQVRVELEFAKGKSYSTLLEVTKSPGLGELANPTTEIATSSRDQLVDLLGKMTTATLGIAGPRGAGKTTLLDALAGDRVPMDEPFRYRCFVMSPTRYDTREFLLHLTSQLSRKVLGNGQGVLDDGPEAYEPFTRQLNALSYLAAGALLVATIAAFVGRTATPVTVGIGIAALAFAILIVNRMLIYGMFPGYRRRILRSNPVYRLRLSAWQLAFVLTATVGIATLVVATTVSPFPLRWFVFGAGLLVGAIVLLWVEMLRRTFFIRTYGIDKDDEDENQHIARRLLEAARYQLTFSKSLSASFTFNVKAASLGGQATSGISRAQLPKTLPDIVTEFRSFAESISRRGRTLVCIDELDKIADPDDVEKFLNDVKAVFSIPNCLFVLSVSLDALRSFEKRGLPVRTAVDSSFDEIIRVGYLDWPSARLLLIRRVTGVPVPFWAICFCLSGGLPRDLVRAARLVFRVAGSSPRKLSEIVEGVISSELTSRAAGMAGSMLDEESDLDFEFGDWVTNVPGPVPIDLWQHIDQFRILADAIPPSAGPREARLGELLNFVTFVLLCCTMIQVFTDDLSQPQLEACENAAEERAFEKLSAARQQIAISPANAWKKLVVYRRAWNLTTPRAPVAAWD